MTDALGMRRALPPRMLPSLVAAMTFLAALAVGGALAARLLAQRWNAGAGAIITVQVPDPWLPNATGSGQRRIDAVLARLDADQRLVGLHLMATSELTDLLRPWLGSHVESFSLPLPAVVQGHLAGGAEAPSDLAQSLAAVAPGTLVEDSAIWSRRLLLLTDSLQACAGFALLTVAFVGSCVVALATRAGISTRRHAIEIVHGLGAGDGMIAGRFARRAAYLALIGGASGAMVALPPLAILSHLAAPFATSRITPDNLPGSMSAQILDIAASLPAMLPLPLLLSLPMLPIVACLIGWLTAQATVRLWLRRLP